MESRECDVFDNAMDVVRVYRPEKEVFRRDAMWSLAHRPITLDHPDTKVDASNWKQLAVGKSNTIK